MYKGWSIVAHPGIIGRDINELDIFISAQQRFCLTYGRPTDHYLDRLIPRDRIGKCDKLHLGGMQIHRPRFLVVWPTHPHRRLGMPFGGHSKSSWFAHLQSGKSLIGLRQKSIDKTACQIRIGINTTIAKKGPMRSCCFDQIQITIGQQGLGRIVGCNAQKIPIRIGDKRRPPELNVVFTTDSVGGDQKDPIGNGMGPHHCLPRIELTGTKLCFLTCLPTNGGRIDEDFGARSAVRRAASGNHWSQQIQTPICPTEVEKL